jgi:hypothetical protein
MAAIRKKVAHFWGYIIHQDKDADCTGDIVPAVLLVSVENWKRNKGDVTIVLLHLAARLSAFNCEANKQNTRLGKDVDTYNG